MQLTSDLAYIVGALRDGSISRFTDKHGRLHHSITFYSKSKGWLEILQKKLCAVFGKTPEIVQYSNKTPYIRIYSKNIAEMFSKEFEHPLGVQIRWNTPKSIKSSNYDIKRHFIAGMWDAEGGIDLQNKQIKFYLSWDGNKCPPLDDLKNILGSMGIKSGEVCRYKNENGKFPRFVLRISTDSNKKFVNDIPIQHPEKTRKAHVILSSV